MYNYETVNNLKLQLSATQMNMLNFKKKKKTFTPVRNFDLTHFEYRIHIYLF